ncbi:acetylornithine aminotransferase [Rhizina undulata]
MNGRLRNPSPVITAISLCCVAGVDDAMTERCWVSGTVKRGFLPIGGPAGNVIDQLFDDYLQFPPDHSSDKKPFSDNAFGGYPLTSRVGHYVFEQLSKPDVFKEFERIGELFNTHLKDLQYNFPEVTEVQGIGLISGTQMSMNKPHGAG